MQPQPNNLDEIYLAALALPGANERAAFLDQACAGNPDQRERVERLLRAQPHVERFLESVAPPFTPTITEPQNPEKSGTQIGPYKLLEQIGEGGMGTVWMAQQTEPVKRLVAVKLIKAGMDSSQVIARFEAERQALALMDHANIARVLDAGTTSAGRPYFVMDLVKGAPITRYCDEHHLTPRQRLELFIPVCQAVQHAHQKGIIHRDLKPSNVLVAPYDGKPVPKVIDFGVAKAAGQRLTDKTLFTGFGALVGTPEYMSPEQAEVNNQDIDTRSDIYSLGVLLYELLAGSPPFTRKDLEMAGMLEMLRVIREQEPSKPSMKLSTADGLPTLAANRGTEPAKLTNLVRGELDWIVMKALEKDRTRRYETANGFSLDIQRYLADEPVLACPPSASYRLRKFARRHKGPAAAVSLVLLALVAGIIGTTWGLVRADKARKVAVAAQLAEAARAAGESRAKVEAQMAAEAERKAKDAESAQRRRAEDNATLAFAVLDDIIGGAQQRLSLSLNDEAKGQAKNPELERLDRELLTKTLAIYEKLALSNANDWAARRRRARAYANIGLQQYSRKNYVESEKAYHQAVQLMEDLASERPDDFENAYDLAYTYLWSFRPYCDTARLEPSEEILRHAQALFLKLVTDFPHHPPEVQQNRAYCERNLGHVLRKAGKLPEAEKAYQQAVAIWVELAAANPKSSGCRNALACDQGYLGDLFRQTGRVPEAIDAWRQASLLLEKVVEETKNARDFRSHLDSRWHMAGWLERLAETLLDQGDFAEAAQIAQKLPSALLNHGQGYSKAVPFLIRCGQLAEKDGRLSESDRKAAAQAYFDSAREFQRQLVKGFPNDPEALNSGAWQMVAGPEPRLHDPAQAVDLAKRAVDLAPKNGQFWNTLGAAHYRAGNWKDAIAALETAMELRNGGDAFGWFFLAMAEWQRGNKDEARRWYDKGAEWRAQKASDNKELQRFEAEAREVLGIKDE